MTSGTATLTEIFSQPDTWRRAIKDAAAGVPGLPAEGERALVLGCGTSYYVARAYALLREAAGHGTTDAVVASELPPRLREYDRVLAISRSGMSSDLVQALQRIGDVPLTAIVGVLGTPVADAAQQVIDMSYADETSVVQTRFATSTLVLLRATVAGPGSAGILALPEAAERALASALPATGIRQLVVLGHDWAEPLTQEGALKVREAAGAWAEAYATGEYRHGPISVASAGTLVWAMTGIDGSLAAAIEATGARVEAGGLDPLAELVRLHRFAVEMATAAGRDADRPTHLSRSVVLPAGQ
jgi:fructoselysine-6-P-deglycase FrlB-like protein